MILLLGASGYIGAAYQRLLNEREVPYRIGDRVKDRYLHQDGLRKLIRELKPNFVINAAGFSGHPNVDACELFSRECLIANTVFPTFLKEICSESKIPWGHVSSGCIYTGSRPDGSGFREEDPPNFSFRQNNCSFYSGTKALAEDVLQNASQCYRWRIRMPFDHIEHPRNYLKKVTTYDRLLDARNSLSQLDDFVRATWECWTKRLPFDIYNVTNPGSITTHEIVDLISASPLGMRLKGKGKVFSFFPSEEEFMNSAAKAPRSHCTLDSSKLVQYGIQLDEVHEAVRKTLGRWQ